MKRVTLTAILIAILVGGIVFVNLSGFGTSILSVNPQASNGNGNSGNSSGGNGNSGDNGNNGNGVSNDNGGNGNNGNGADGGNENSGSGNSGTGNNGNGNGNNENNGNGNNGNVNGTGNGNGNSNGNNGNGNNGNGNSGTNGNSGNGNYGNNNSNNGNGGTNNGNTGNGNNSNDNGNGNQNGNGNNGSNGNSGNGNGGSNDNNNGNGNGNNSGNNGSNGSGANNGNNGNGSGGNGNNGNGNQGTGGAGNNGNGNSGNNDNGSNGGSNGSNGNGNSSGGNSGNGNGNSGNGNGNGGSNNGNSRYKISGYILDSSGKPIEGAQIIYCVPDIVPAQFSDKTGYYEVNAPAGQYQVDVWPPFNSHYIFYEQKYLTVTQDMRMDIVLQTGYRLSGVITLAGAPVSGAVVWLDNPAQGNHYFCGWYSKADGSYFVTAPPGTYTLRIQPKTGLNFPSYQETITISGDMVRNFALGSQNSQNPSISHVATLSLSMSYNSLQVGSVLHFSGKLLGQNANPLAGKTVVLSYAVANTGVYTPIGSGTTDSTGLYKIDWLVPASGTFTLKVEWAGNSEIFPASSTTTFTFSA